MSRLHSLRWRLAFTYVLILAVVLGAVLAAVNIAVERVLIDNTASRLAVGAGLVATTGRTKARPRPA